MLVQVQVVVRTHVAHQAHAFAWWVASVILCAAHAAPERLLGTDPATGAPVTLRRGPYGAYVQLGGAQAAAHAHDPVDPGHSGADPAAGGHAAAAPGVASRAAPDGGDSGG